MLSAELQIELEMFGFVTGIYRCDCGSYCSIRPDLLLSSKVKVAKLKPGKALARFVNSADLELNHSLLLAMLILLYKRYYGSSW
jgi:hypothetical protein